MLKTLNKKNLTFKLILETNEVWEKIASSDMIKNVISNVNYRLIWKKL